MIVDCHTHIDTAFAQGETAPEQLEEQDTVEKCIVLAAAGPSTKQVNENLSQYVGKNKEKMTGFAFVQPTKDKVNVKSLASITEKLELKGLVLYCSSCGFHPAHSKAMQLYEAAEELSLPIFFHNASHLKSTACMEYAQPYLLDEIARKFGGLKIIIGSMGLPFVDQTLALVAKHENVYADLTIGVKRTWRVYNTVVSAYESSVLNKLLFGSGFPFGDAGECLETLLGFNKLLSDTNLPTVPRAEIKSIIERDTLKLLGIE